MSFVRCDSGLTVLPWGPFELAWQTLISRRAGGRLSRCGDAIFLELARTDGRLLVLLADAVGNGENEGDLIRQMNWLLTKESQLQGLEPSLLLRRLHGYLAPLFARGWGQVATTVLVLDATNHIGSVYRADVDGDSMVCLELGGWARVTGDTGPALGRPRGQAVKITTAEDLYPSSAEVTYLHGVAVAAFTRGVTDAWKNESQTQRFGVDAVKGLLPTRNSLRPATAAADVVDAVMVGVKAYSQRDPPEEEASAIVVRLP